jgi:hypothetical protein
MTDSQILVSTVSASLVALAAVGLVSRHRARLCWTFFFYLVVLVVGNRLPIWRPDTFHTPAFWTVKIAVYSAMQALIALEITLLTFSGLPRARRRAELSLGFVLCIALGATLLPESSSYPYLTMLGVVAPRDSTTSLWLFVAVLVLAWRYRAPVHPFHRKLLLAFTAYLGTEVYLLKLVGLAASSRPEYLAAFRYLEVLDPLAFLATAAFWAWWAWRPEVPSVLGRVVAERLQPWADVDPVQRPTGDESSDDDPKGPVC